MSQPEQQTHIRVLAPGGAMRARFSDAVVVGPMVFVSGCVPLDDDARLVGAGDAGAQARQTFDNLRRVLLAAGAAVGDIVKLTTFVTDAKDYEAISAGRREALGPLTPASTLVQVAALLVPGAVLEVEAVAVIGSARAANGEATSQT
jgi:enamine deaminase RidA (YjgF/YER057c/UK114 family)